VPIFTIAGKLSGGGRTPAPLQGGAWGGRFMESPHDFETVHWDHEPDLHKSLNDE